MKTKHATTRYLEDGMSKVILPAGLPVISADNLPPDSRIKYWLAKLPRKLARHPSVESYFRNIGFGFTENEVTD